MSRTTMSIRCNDCGATLSHWYEDVWECVTCGKVVQEMDFSSEVALARAEAKLDCTSFDQTEFPMRNTTEKVKHTSGPWFTDIRTVNTSDHHVVTVECSDGMGRARLADCGPIGAIGSICDLENGANARLIAASPDLAAFAQAVSFAPYLLTPDQWATEARQVLEKAGLL